MHTTAIPRLMSTVNPMTSSDALAETAARQHHRRSREEVEALAKNFVATPVEAAPAPAKPRVRLVLAAGGAMLLTVLAFSAWPEREATPPGPAETARPVTEAEQWRQRYEAERERKRQELASGQEYLQRIAAADNALLNDMTARAENLAGRSVAVASAPASGQVPTPREEPAKAANAVPATAPSKAPANSSQSATTGVGTPPKPASAPAPAPQQQVAKAAPAEPAPPVTVQAAPVASCSIHVSELSSSGKLTYADVARMKGARVDTRTGHVFTPPVQAAGGRTVIFEVMPSGCVRLARR